MCEALYYLLDNIFIPFGSKLYEQIVGIPIVTNCAPLVADMFLISYERDSILCYVPGVARNKFRKPNLLFGKSAKSTF